MPINPKRRVIALLLATAFGLVSGAASAQRVPRVPDTGPASCDGFADFRDELAPSNWQIVGQMPVGPGYDQVELSVDLTNQQEAAFSGASLVPDFSAANLDVVAESVLPAEFGAIATNATVASTNPLLVWLPSANVADLVARLGSGEIPVAVLADEEPVLEPGVLIRSWGGNEDAYYAYARDNFQPAVNLDPGPPPYAAGQEYTIVLMTLGDRVNSVVDEAAGTDAFYLIPDPAQPLTEIPEPLHYVRVLDVDRSDEENENSPDSQDGVTYWLVTLARTDTESLPAIYTTASFCTGDDAFVDLPVQATRIAELDGATQSDAFRDFHGQPIRLNDLSFAGGAVTVSGQLAGHALRPSLELRIRPNSVRAVADIDTDLSLSAELRAQVSGSFDQEISLYDLCFPLASFQAGPIPIGLNLQVGHTVGIGGSFAAGAVVGFQKDFSGGFTVGFDGRRAPGDQYFSESHHEQPHPVEFTPPLLTDETAAHGEVSTDIRTTLRVGGTYPFCDTGAGAYLDARAFGTVDVDPLLDPWWQLGHGAELYAGIDLQILGLDVASHDTNPVSILGSDTRGAPAGPPPVAARVEGVDQRWAVGIDDVDVVGGTAETALAAFSDGSSLVLEREATGRNWQVRLDRFGAYQSTVHYTLGYIPRFAEALPDDSYVVAGTPDTWIARYDAAGSLLWNFQYEVGDATDVFGVCEAKAITPVEESPGVYGFVVVGRVGRSLVTQRDTCAFRVDPNGAIVWANLYIDAGAQEFNALTLTSDGGVAVVGRTETGPDAFSLNNPLVAKLDLANGSLRWAKSLPMTGRIGNLYAVAEAEDGTLVAAGAAAGIITDNASALLARVAADGGDPRHGMLMQDEAWEAELDFETWTDTEGGDSQYDTFFDLVPAPGGFVVTGKTGLGDDEAAWVAKINQSLGVEWFTTFDGADSDDLDSIVKTPDGYLASGWSDSLEAAGQESNGRWAWLMKLPFEGRIELLPLGITTRYLAPGVRFSSADATVVPDGVVSMDAPLAVEAATLATATADLDIFTTPQEICVHLLTPTGHVSTLDGCADDLDGDGTLDDTDNCVGTANATQIDSDADGHGNFCDADLDASNAVDGADFIFWQQGFGFSADDPNFDPDADFDGDGAVGVRDLAVLHAMQGSAPGDPVALPAPDPSDMPLVEVIFSETGTSEITAAPGEVVTAQIAITADAAGLSAYSVSLSFDDELDFQRATELLPAGFDLNLTPGVAGSVESEPGVPGFVWGCEAAEVALGGPDTTERVVCEVELVVTDAVSDDGEDVTVGLFDASVDGLLAADGSNVSAQAVFAGATVPEPDALASGLAALAAMAMAFRRGDRSR